MKRLILRWLTFEPLRERAERRENVIAQFEYLTQLAEELNANRAYFDADGVLRRADGSKAL